jgi:ParB-like chromosome segregation protein Spo0J
MIETIEAPTETTLDNCWNPDVRKPESRNGKLFMNPFGVVLGNNLSGQTRGEEVLHDKAFMNTTRRFGVIQPVIVRRIDHEGVKAFIVVAGNRRTFAMRHLVASSELEGDKALLPVYEMNTVDLEHVSPEDAANLLENGMRKGLDHISKANAIDRLISGGASPEEVALLVTGPNGKPLGREAIRQYRALLKLHPSVQEAVKKNVMMVSKAATIVDFTEAEQLQALALILEAQGMSHNKHAAADEVIKKMKAEKRYDEDGEQIFDSPRNAVEIRRMALALSKIENWDCLPKTSKLSNEGYAIVASIFSDIEAWLQGGLTPKKYDPANIALTLQTRILATMAPLTPKLAK